MATAIQPAVAINAVIVSGAPTSWGVIGKVAAVRHVFVTGVNPTKIAVAPQHYIFFSEIDLSRHYSFAKEVTVWM
jgi:hypothetical protein